MRRRHLRRCWCPPACRSPASSASRSWARLAAVTRSKSLRIWSTGFAWSISSASPAPTGSPTPPPRRIGDFIEWPPLEPIGLSIADERRGVSVPASIATLRDCVILVFDAPGELRAGRDGHDDERLNRQRRPYRP